MRFKEKNNFIEGINFEYYYDFKEKNDNDDQYYKKPNGEYEYEYVNNPRFS